MNIMTLMGEYINPIICGIATIGVFFLYLSTQGVVWKTRKFESEEHRKKLALTYILTTIWGGAFFVLMVIGVI